jgi:uncharacterized protein (DUF58 family)
MSSSPARTSATLVPDVPTGESRSLWQRLYTWWEDRDADINIRMWLGYAAGVLVVAALLREPILALLGLAVAVIGLILRLWWDHALDKLSYRRSFSETRAFWGDTVSVELTAENAKPLPISRLDVSEIVSSHISIPGHELGRPIDASGRLFETLFSLGMYERVTHRFTLECTSRGWHRFGPVTIQAHDPFGMVSRSTTLGDREGVLVYPRMVPMTELVVPARQPLGDMKPATPLVEDPMRMSGVRPYVPGDSPRRIHWRASARTGELQTRVFEPSASPVAAIFLDTITFSHLWEGQSSSRLELLVVVAASMSRQLLEGRHQVGLYANAPIPNVSRTIRISPGRRPGQLTRVLEDLARLAPAYGDKIGAMISEEIHKLPWGASIVLITSQLSADVQRTLLRLARSSGARRFVIIVVDEQPPELFPELRRRFSVYYLGTEEAWDVIEQIRLTRIS